MDDRENLSQLASVITLPESNRRARIYRKKVALPLQIVEIDHVPGVIAIHP
jgi:hypothetical protein